MIPPPSIPAKRGFTLVELLVAIAVLSLLVVLVSKIVGGASTITTYNNSHMDSNDQARLVFDRMALDFSRMLKRPDVDIIFCKQSSNMPTGTQPGPKGINDTMFFFTESSGDSQPSTATWSNERNNISLVGYRINNDATTAGSPYGQLERLGKSLPWDAPSTGNNSNYSMVYLTYPTPTGSTPPGTGTISTAYTASTMIGAFPATSESLLVPPIGTAGSPYYFNNGLDPDYHVLGNQVFRFEYSFVLKDGSQSNIPIIQSTYNATSNPNGVPNGNFTPHSGPPTGSLDINKGYVVGARLYDTTNNVGYICTNAGIKDPTKTGYAIWKQIGVQDISAIVITIATIDNAGRYMINSAFKSNTTLLGNLAQDFPKWSGTPGAMNPNSADNLVNSWQNAILPNGTAPSLVSSDPNVALPQSVVSRIRVYQRFFYLNTP